jgi:Primase C terminal 1 (PriCT-1)./Replicase family.
MIIHQDDLKSKAEFSAYAPFIDGLGSWCLGFPNKEHPNNIQRPKEKAIKFPWIEPFPEGRRAAIIVDCDYEGAAFADEDNDLPSATYIRINPTNAHAQLFWYLSSPVSFGGHSRSGPQKLFLSVEHAVRQVTECDRNFKGHITKNVIHPQWRDKDTLRTYDLHELADSTFHRVWPMKQYRREKREFMPTEGRHVKCFNDGRYWAYSNARKYQSPAALEADIEKIMFEANQAFPLPLPLRELARQARNVALWTWPRRFQFHVRNTTASAEDLKARQVESARQTNEQRRARTASKIAEAKAMLSRDGNAPSIRQIADFCGLGKSTVADALKTLPPTLF